MALNEAETRHAARIRELEEELRRARDVNTVLREVGMAIGTTVELDPLLELIVARIIQVLEADRATLYLVKGDKLLSRIKKGDELQTIVLDLGQGLAGHVARTGETLHIRDAYFDERFDPKWDEQSGYRTHSVLSVPLKSHDGAIIGVVQVINKLGPDGITEFTSHDAELLDALAMQAAIALDKSDLFLRLLDNNRQLSGTKKMLECSLRDLELLYELETAMSRSASVRELSQSVITLTASACEAMAGGLLFETGGDQLTLHVVNLEQPEVVHEVIVQPGEGIAARAMKRGEQLLVEDPRKVRDPTRLRELLGIRVRSAIAVPLPGEAGRPCGAMVLYNRSGRPSRFDAGDAALIRLVSANVSTEIRLFHARRERERAEHLSTIGRLLSGVLHDLRTPLTVIHGYVQLMEVTDDPELRLEYGQTVAEQFALIAAMQQDLLAYAKGEKSVLIRKVYVAKFFEEIARQVEAQLKGTDVRYVMDVRKEATVAFFDESKIARAIHNLVRNAIEAMQPREGTLTIGCQLGRDGDLVISVADTGPGVSKAIRRRLFEPFVTSGKKTGTGLGLSIVKDIVEEHQGSVEVDTAPQKGTKFTIRLPQQQRRPQSRRNPGGELPRSGPGP